MFFIVAVLDHVNCCKKTLIVFTPYFRNLSRLPISSSAARSLISAFETRSPFTRNGRLSKSVGSPRTENTCCPARDASGAKRLAAAAANRIEAARLLIRRMLSEESSSGRSHQRNERRQVIWL